MSRDLFERLHQGGGTQGINLYLSRRLVEAHGGTLAVETALGQGTTFWLALPAGQE